MAKNNSQVAPQGAGARGGPGNGTPAVDSRIIETIIRAVYKYDSFILKYDWVEKELKNIVGNEDEYRALEEKMYELISDGEVKNVKIIFRHVDSIGDSVVAVAPCTLTEEQWEELEELADLYDYDGYEDPTAYKYDYAVERDRPSLDIVMHNLIRAWCIMRYIDDNAREVYETFKKEYGLEKSFEEITKDVEP
jgi:hypothetical protein